MPEDALLEPLWGGSESAISALLVGKAWPEITLAEIRAVYDEIAEIDCRSLRTILPALMRFALDEEADYERYATMGLFSDPDRYRRSFFSCLTDEQTETTDRFLSLMDEVHGDSVGLKTGRSLALWRRHMTNAGPNR